MIDLRRPLPVLASRLPWQEIETSIVHFFAREVGAGQTLEDVDLFDPALTALRTAGSSDAGRVRLPLCLMISLLYLERAFDESDEALARRWSETPAWQYFSGHDYFENGLPCDPTLLVKFRRLLGEQGVEELLARTLEAAVNLRLMAKEELGRITVDCTVQEKACCPPPPTENCCKRLGPNWSMRPKKKALSPNKPSQKKASFWATKRGATHTRASSGACARSSNASAPSLAACSARCPSR